MYLAHCLFKISRLNSLSISYSTPSHRLFEFFIFVDDLYRLTSSVSLNYMSDPSTTLNFLIKLYFYSYQYKSSYPSLLITFMGLGPKINKSFSFICGYHIWALALNQSKREDALFFFPIILLLFNSRAIQFLFIPFRQYENLNLISCNQALYVNVYIAFSSSFFLLNTYE